MGTLGRSVIEHLEHVERERQRRAKLTRWQRLCEDMAKPGWFSEMGLKVFVLAVSTWVIFVFIVGLKTIWQWMLLP